MTNLSGLPPTGDDAAPPCAICGGAGWFKEAALVGHPRFGRLVPCRCTLAAQGQRAADELARLSGLAAFTDQTFATFNPLVPGLWDVVTQVKAYARRPAGWLTLMGSYGVGKTHLAAAVGHAVRDRGEAVLFTVVPDLLDHLRVTFGPESLVSYDARFEAVRSAPLLILDDLGTESATAWAREKLYQLVNHRYNARLATVVTTNLAPAQIEPRIFSRLCDPSRGVVLTIQAADYRRRAR